MRQGLYHNHLSSGAYQGWFSTNASARIGEHGRYALLRSANNRLILEEKENSKAAVFCLLKGSCLEDIACQCLKDYEGTEQDLIGILKEFEK